MKSKIVLDLIFRFVASVTFLIHTVKNSQKLKTLKVNRRIIIESSTFTTLMSFILSTLDRFHEISN